MRSLNRKLLRDIWAMKGQALAIALVIAGGVATFVMSVSTLDSLHMTRDGFYRDYRFADVFANLKRAPEPLAARIREIPGVDRVETRVTAPVNVDIEGFPDPVTGRLVSIPDGAEPLLNNLYLRTGRLVEPGRDDEVVISEAFANAHRLVPGNTLAVVVNGRRRTLTITGIALSPEHLFVVSPGSLFPDFKRFGIFWMGRKALASAYDMEGAFNDVSLALTQDASVEDVIDRVDSILKPYGGLGAYGRKDQLSNRFLYEDLRQLANMAVIFPTIFLGVAAFLLNIVLSRLVSTQRDQIAILKAFGYGNLAIGVHYVKLVAVISVIGVAAGTFAGTWLGSNLSGLYMKFYRFPYLDYELAPAVVFYAALICAGAAITGTVYSVYRAAMLPPAEAMNPEPPPVYRETLVERAGIKRLLAQPSRMIMRQLERRPAKALLTVTGIALSAAIMMTGSFFGDAVDYMVDVQFGLAEREDISVTYVEAASRGSLHELRSIPGVEYAEPYRSVPARLRFEHRTYRTSVNGLEPDAVLHRLLDTDLAPVELPEDGVVLTDHLGRILGIQPGDTLTIEVLEGSRPVRRVLVTGLVSQYMGVGAYMRLTSLNRLLREGDSVSGVYLAADSKYQEDIYAELKEIPRVAGVAAHRDAVRNFYDTMADQVLIFTFFNTILAATIAFGVVYNSARISLSERSRELASLRVLGFTRAEISYILLGELALLTLASIPLGFVIGRWLCAYIISQLQTDLYRIPLVLEPGTYAFSATVVLVSACISGFIVRRRLDTLDLVAVLKTRE